MYVQSTFVILVFAVIPNLFVTERISPVIKNLLISEADHRFSGLPEQPALETC